MQERILIAPNGTELLRTLARSGVSTLGLRIMRLAELAQFALMRSGIQFPERMIGADEETALIYRLLTDIPYFQNASYRDAQNLSGALRLLRMQIVENEGETIAAGLKNSPFTEKNTALLDVYDRYMNTLQSSDLTDTIGMMRFAACHAKPLLAEIMLLQEHPLTPLEAALVSHLSGGNDKTISLCELLGISGKPFTMPQITESYGAANEAEYVIGTIYQNNTPLDQCVIAVTDAAAYAPLLFELTSRFGISATFGCGLPITLSQPAAVLRDYRSWLTTGHCGIDALRALVGGTGFDTAKFCEDFGLADRKQFEKFIETAGNMRLSNDADRNSLRISAFQASEERDAALISQLKSVFVDFGMDCAGLIRRYAVIRKNDLGRLDNAAQHQICDTLERFTAMTGESPVTLIPDLLQTRICAENNREGALHITGISGALTALRQNLFVMGLSAELFPGAPTENYLLLDDELAVFGESSPTSLYHIRQTQQTLQDLLQTANALGVHTSLSYCGYDTAELKENNASSVLFELYQQAGGADEKEFVKQIQHTGYFSQNISDVTEIGRAYLRGEKTAAHLPESAETAPVTGIMTSLSPSTIEEFMICPKAFCYNNVLHLTEPETDHVFEVINPRKFGNLVHKAMEFLYQNGSEEEAFMQNAERILARFLSERPPMNQSDADKMRADYLSTVRTGFARAAGIRITEPEQDIQMQYDCGITVHGRPDALAEMPDGSFRVIDYKTGRTLKHENHDAVSCIQVMLYADMLRRMGKTISAGEYWYLRLNKTISCDFTQERADLIEEKLAGMADAIRTNTYPANASKNNCQYCPYRQFCAEGSAEKC